jgi:hypothetical protein
MEANEPNPATPDQPRPIVKRRWAVVRRASGGAAVVAITGALALGGAADSLDSDDQRSGGNPHIAADA